MIGTLIRVRRRSRPWWLVATAAAVVASSLLAPAAVAHGPDPVLGGEALYAQSKDLRFRWLTGAVPPLAMRSAILAGAADSNGSRLSRAPVFTYDANGPSFVQYGGDVVCGVNGLACMRRDEPDAFRMYFREQGHVFDWGTMKWCEMYTNPPNGCYDAENVALDEFGHVHILGHHLNESDESDYLDAVVQEYSRTKPSAGFDAHAFGRCDVATLQREYGLLTASTKVSTCLDLISSLTLAASDTSARYDQPVTLTATLEISDRDAYERLGGQNLSGRTVRLERRPPGGAWTDLGPMAAGPSAGTYVFSFNARYTAEFRATFAKPSGEGLRSSTSPVIRIDVTACYQSCPTSGGPQPAGGAR